MSQIDQLHFSFFLGLAQGHMLPAIDMAKLFSSRGLKVTLITTHEHVPMCTKATQRSRDLGFDISVLSIKFPASEVGLPEGIESLDQVTSEDTHSKFFKALTMLQEPLEQLLQQHRPHCLVADMLFPWTTEVAAKFGIPRLLFLGTSCFALCAGDSLRRNRPQDGVSSDSEPFVLPNLPHQIKLTRSQIPIDERDESIENNFITEFFKKVWDSETMAFGVINNTFYELEPDYADYYINVLGRKAWNVGPFLLHNINVEDKAHRGKNSAIDTEECLKWLDSKQQNSVIYICFGSLSSFCVAQLHEIAAALENSGQQFVWVVRNCRDEEDEEKWFPEGFVEKNVKSGKGLVIKGWAPQQLILEHEAVGTFVTHCGWNSVLEGICVGGVPAVTWPLFSEKFANEKFLTDVVKIGVPVGSQEWSYLPNQIIEREAITKALNQVMADDEEIHEMRARAKALKEMAQRAIEEGGSSYSDLTALIHEITAYHHYSMDLSMDSNISS